MSDTVSLKEYVDARLDNIEKNTELARVGIDTRLGSMNEFRGQIKDQASTFITRNELNAELNSVKNDIKVLIASKNKIAGKASQKSVNFAQGLSIAGLIIGILAIIIKFI